MPWEDPDALLVKKLSREEYCQRMLTSLILGAPYPKWNTLQKTSPNGETFLQELHGQAYGTSLDTPITFIDEFKLPSVDGKDSSRYPDYAVITPTRLWIIELKTEQGSHRSGQLPLYARLATHHYPAHQIEITYLTGQMPRETSFPLASASFCHIFWSEVVGLINQTWKNSVNKPEQILASAIFREINNLHVPAIQFRNTAKLIRDAIALAMVVQNTGKQVGIEVKADGFEALHDLRKRIREVLVRPECPNVLPWIWSAASSGGSPLTSLGEDVGYEIRLSKYKKSFL